MVPMPPPTTRRRPPDPRASSTFSLSLLPRQSIRFASWNYLVAFTIQEWSERDQRHRRVRAGLALAARVAMSERSRGDASDIDGQNRRMNGAFGKSGIEGKAAMGSGERAGKRTSFKWAGAHESVRATSEVQFPYDVTSRQ
jgi:hypothetical protein